MSRILDTPISVNQMELPNRLVMPPMATSKSGAEGNVTDELCNYYREKSYGGYIGLIITEHSYISKEGKANKAQVSIAEDAMIPGLKRLVDVIHQNGTKAFCQINHAGGFTAPAITGSETLSASAVRAPGLNAAYPTPREMTLPDIQKVIDDFVRAALRAKAAGYDGVEIHSAHSYLLNQFYSPLTNKRTDAYTGSTLEGRIRLHLDVIRAVRQAVGKDYPLSLRLGACDYMKGGTTIADSVEASKCFEQAGIDLLDISGGLCRYISPVSKEQGYFAEISEAVKDAVSIPVILTGGIVNAEAAERLLEGSKADLIGVGRAIMRDSNWAKQAMGCGNRAQR